MNIKANIVQITHSKNFRNGMLYTMFSFVNSGIGFVLLLILAKYLTPPDYGSLNLFTTFITLLNFVITLCTTSYITVSFFQKPKETVRKIILIAFCTATGMLVIIAMVMLMFPSLVEHTVGVPIEYLWLGVMICYFGVFNSVNLDIWRLEEKPVTYGLYGVSFAVCNFILTYWLIIGMHMGWEGRVYAWFMLGALYFVVSLTFLIKRGYLVFSCFSWSLVRETYIYAMPLLPHSASFWLKQGLDRYIINYFHDQTTVGYFSFAMNLAAIITIIGNAFNSTNSVYIYKKLSYGYNKAHEVLSKQAKIMTAVFLAVSIAVGLFAFALIHYFIPRYEKSICYILPLCLGAFFQCIYLLWVNYLFYYKKTRQLMHITLSTAILQVILSLWLTPYSALYTAYTSMTITFITMIYVYVMSNNTLNSAK